MTKQGTQGDIQLLNTHTSLGLGVEPTCFLSTNQTISTMASLKFYKMLYNTSSEACLSVLFPIRNHHFVFVILLQLCDVKQKEKKYFCRKTCSGCQSNVSNVFFRLRL